MANSAISANSLPVEPATGPFGPNGAIGTGIAEKSAVKARNADEDDIAERTAIIEVETGAPKEWAEGVARLCAMSRPSAIPSGRWQQLVDDGARFVECYGAEAAALGWDTLAIFGVDARRPLARLDQAGAVALLDGRDVVRLDAERIVLKSTATGGLLSIYRKPDSREPRVLLWELSPLLLNGG